MNEADLKSLQSSQAHAVLFDETVTGVLKVAEEDLYYPIMDGIVCLLPQCVVPTPSTLTWDETTKNVKSFYDTLGWSQKKGVYQDAADSEDRRQVSDEYIQRCHQRVKSHLPKKGQYLLDIASGPLQYPAYLSYSENYDIRICADISITALREAKRKLQDKGMYVLCDITQLPFVNNSIDAVVSLHTLYHVPAQQQAKGFSELHRVLKPGGSSVIVYSWGPHCALMKMTMFPFKWANALKRRLQKQPSPLYFYTYPYRWLSTEIQAKYTMSIYSWRSVTVPFLRVFIHPWLGGRWLLRGIAYLEERFPTLMGRIGAYPLLVSVKQ